MMNRAARVITAILGLALGAALVTVATALATDSSAPVAANRDIIAHCTGCDFGGVDWHGADLHGLTFTGDDLRRADLHDANLRDATLTGVDLTGAKLDGADLSGATLEGVDLKGATFNGVKAAGLRISGTTVTTQMLHQLPARDVQSGRAECAVHARTRNNFAEMSTFRDYAAVT